jgi:hypothetical protein
MDTRLVESFPHLPECPLLALSGPTTPPRYRAKAEMRGRAARLDSIVVLGSHQRAKGHRLSMEG